jgi:hypothetical protein
MTYATAKAKPSASGNKRVWISCPHRRFTVRKSKVATLEPCKRCAASANTTKEKT